MLGYIHCNSWPQERLQKCSTLSRHVINILTWHILFFKTVSCVFFGQGWRWGFGRGGGVECIGNRFRIHMASQSRSRPGICPYNCIHNLKDRTDPRSALILQIRAWSKENLKWQTWQWSPRFLFWMFFNQTYYVISNVFFCCSCVS